MPRNERALQHKTEPRLEFFRGIPSDKEGQDGDKRFCYIPDKGLYHYVRYLGKWMSSPVYEETLGKLNKSGLNTENVSSDHDIRLRPARNVEIKEKKDIGTGDFTAGFVSGAGWRLRHVDNEYNMEVDSMTVRGTLHVYEMLIQQLRATNGTVVVSSAAKTESATSSTITFDDPSGHGVCPFADNDIIMCQRVNLNSTTVVKRIVRRVTDVNGKTVTITRDGDLPSDTLTIEKGDDFVRIGNTTNTDRRGGVLITSDLANAPFIEIFDGVSSWSTWQGTSKIKARLGQLSGIVDSDANLNDDTKFGLYTNDVNLKGHLFSQSGEIAGWTLGATSLSKNSATLSSSGVLTLGSGDAIVKLSAVDDYYRIWAGNADPSGADFKVHKDGTLTATGATISGAITLTNSISSSNISDVSAYTTNQDKQKLSTLVGDSPTGSGLFMTSSYLGYYQNSEWTSYLGSNGDFFLAKDNGAGGTGGLSWDSSAGNLTISGSITVLGGNAETTTGSQTKATAAQVAAISAAAGDATTKADAAEASAEAASLSKATYLSSGVTTIDGGNITADTVTAGAILVNAALIGNLFAEEATIGASGFIQSSNFSAGSAGFKIHGNGTAEFDSVTVRSGSAGWNLQTDGTAFLGNNRVKAHTDGNLSIHGDEDGTTALVFYPGTDDPPDHTGTSWNIFRDDTNDFGISYSGNTKMLFSTDKVEIGSGNKLFLGVGADADTGFRRNSGSLDFYANDSINTKMTLDTSGNISLAGGSISGVEGITFSSAVNNGKGITNVTDTGPCHSNVVYSVASADASNVCVITFNNASWGTVVVEMVIARSTGSTGGTILDVIKGYSGANPTVASTDTQGNDQTAYREWAFSTGSATLKLKSSGTTNTTTAMIKLVSSNRPANSDITVAWS
jgi:hypothetical protein